MTWLVLFTGLLLTAFWSGFGSWVGAGVKCCILQHNFGVGHGRGGGWKHRKG